MSDGPQTGLSGQQGIPTARRVESQGGNGGNAGNDDAFTAHAALLRTGTRVPFRKNHGASRPFGHPDRGPNQSRRMRGALIGSGKVPRAGDFAARQLRAGDRISVAHILVHSPGGHGRQR